MSGNSFYDLVMFLHTMDDLRRSILISLAHIYPKQVTVAQLSLISGYSKKSKYIYRSKVIESLLKDGMIRRTKISSNVQLIQLNDANETVRTLIELCVNNGEAISSKLLLLLKEDS